MKKIVAAVILSLASAGAIAQPVSNQDKATFCLAFSEIARQSYVSKVKGMTKAHSKLILDSSAGDNELLRESMHAVIDKLYSGPVKLNEIGDWSIDYCIKNVMSKF